MDKELCTYKLWLFIKLVEFEVYLHLDVIYSAKCNSFQD